MSGPWEQYQTEDSPKPWEQYGGDSPAPPARKGAAAIPVGGTQEAPVYGDQLPQRAPDKPSSVARKGLGVLETVAAVGTGATTGLGSGIAALIDNAVKRAGYTLTGQDTAQLPDTEKAFQSGMQAGTYAPRTPEGKDYTEDTAGALATHGSALTGLGPEIGALGKALGTAVKGTRGLGVGGTLKTVTGVEQAGRAVKNVGETVGNTAAKAISKITPDISPETAATVQKAAKFGIDLPPDAFSKNKFAKIAGETSRNVPASGAGSEANAVAMNKVIARKIGAGDADKVTPKVFDDAMNQSGGTIGRITEANDIPMPVVDSTVKTLREASAKRSEGVGQAVEGYLKDIEAKAQENGGIIPGSAMQQIISDLGKDARSSTNGNVRNALGELHSALVDDVAKVLSPDDAKALRKAKQEYSTALMVAPLIRPDGYISPSAFNQAFRSSRAGKMRAARGTGGELGDLAEVSQYMREPGSSLTAERAAVYGALGGGGAVSPPAALGGYAAANAYNRLGPRVLREKAGVGKGAPAGAEPPTPSTGAPPEAPVAPTPAAPTDPRLAEVAKLRESAKSDAVKAALDEHEKTVQKVIKTEEMTKKQAQDVADLEAAANATKDADLKATLLAKADELRPEKLPVGEATDVTPEVVKPAGKIAEPIPVGEVTDIAPEVISPAAEMAWAKEHGLAGPEVARAKNVAKALELDERAVEKAAMQFEKSPVAFDREITRILEKGSENAPESKQVAKSSQSPAARDNLTSATEAPSKQPGANSPAKAGTASEGGSPAGQAKGGIEIRETPEGFEAYRDGKKIGSLKSNLTPKQSKDLKENASVDMVKVEKAEQGKREIGPALYEAWTKAHEGRTEMSGKTETNALKLWKHMYPEKVDAFVKQEADRIKSGSDPQLIVGNIKDPEIAQRVLAAAKEPKGFEKGAKKKGS